MHEFNFFIWLGKQVTWLSWVNESTVHIVSALFVLLVILVLALIAFKSLKNTEEHIVPSSKFSIAGMFDVASEGLLKLMEGVMGDKALKFLPLIGTIFIYIFVCNLLSLLPGFIPPTDNINTNIPCALIVFFYYHFMGIREHGFKKYFKHFAGPIIWLAPLLFSIELISHCVRPLSLSVRLFGNITGDHVVLGIFSELVPLVIPVVFLFLALFVAFIQAFVFSLLSTVYIGLAIEHEN